MRKDIVVDDIFNDCANELTSQTVKVNKEPEMTFIVDTTSPEPALIFNKIVRFMHMFPGIKNIQYEEYVQSEGSHQFFTIMFDISSKSLVEIDALRQTLVNLEINSVIVNKNIFQYNYLTVSRNMFYFAILHPDADKLLMNWVSNEYLIRRWALDDQEIELCGYDKKYLERLLKLELPGIYKNCVSFNGNKENITVGIYGEHYNCKMFDATYYDMKSAEKFSVHNITKSTAEIFNVMFQYQKINKGFILKRTFDENEETVMILDIDYYAHNNAYRKKWIVFRLGPLSIQILKDIIYSSEEFITSLFNSYLTINYKEEILTIDDRNRYERFYIR